MTVPTGYAHEGQVIGLLMQAPRRSNFFIGGRPSAGAGAVNETVKEG